MSAALRPGRRALVGAQRMAGASGARPAVRTVRVATAVAFALAAAHAAAPAQDFESAGHAGPGHAPSGFLDAGLPGAARGVQIEALTLTRYGLPELGTRAAAAAVGWRSLRIAAGLSQTGDPEIGWNAFGLAAGAAQARWGAGLRAAARRDQTVLDPLTRWSFEAGGGAWIALEAPIVLWASAPQMVAAGGAPPLVRGFAMGAALAGAGARAWFQHEARPEVPGAEVAHRAGVALEGGGFTVWAEGLDAPLRAVVGVRGHAARVTVEVSVTSHPLLGDTVRAAVVLGAPPATAAEDA
jgi:hypothetical protein